MSTYTDVSKFLQAVFGDDHETRAILANLNPAVHVRAVDQLDDQRDCYWSVAAFDEGHVSCTKNKALEVRALVIDDVGTKVAAVAVEMALGGPTAITVTSAGNYQWAYRLSAAVPKDDWKAFFSGIERRVGCKLEGKDAVHLFRLPMGVNTKAGRGRFPVQLVELNPEVELATTNIKSVGSSASPAGPGPSVGTAGDMRLDDLRKLMGYIPNDLDRDGWIEVGHGLKAQCADDDDGFTVFDEWSQQHDSYDAAKTRTAWDSFGAGGLKSKGGMLLDRAEKSRAFAKAVFDDGAVHPKIDTLPPGGAQFHEGEKGILLTMENAAIGLNGLGIVCRYDQFHHRVHVRWNGKDMRLTDDLVLLLRVEMNGRYGKDFGPVHIGDAIKALALKNGFNPVTDMLAKAEAGWDGVRRLDRLGPDYFHTDDTELARQCFRKVMLAAVRRARRPGCKFDQILVLESPEGWDKSTAWAVLAGEENFSDADILGKDARAVQEELADVWIHEIADLSGLSRADIEHVKAFASRTNDRARGAYERFLKDQPRQSIEVGTTNSDAYLLSTTGNRRFWPFKLTARVDTARLRADRLALWGEAAVAERGGETLVLAEALWGVAAVEQEKRRAVDVWEDELHNLVDMPAGAIAPVGFERIEDWAGDQYISNLSVQTYLKDDRRITLHPGAGRKIADIMKRLGWDRCSRTVNGATVRGYKRARVTPASVTVTKSVISNPF